MNSKQNVLSVLNHQNPDKIPLGMYAIDCDTVKKIIGRDTFVRNKAGQTLALWEGRRDEVAQSLKEDSIELFEKLDCIDVVIVQKEANILPPENYHPPKVKKLDDYTWEDHKGIIYRFSEVSNEIVPITHKYPKCTIKAFEEDIEPANIDTSMFEAYDHFIEHFKNRLFLLGTSAGFEPLLIFGGMSMLDKGLMEYYLQPELMRKAILQLAGQQNTDDGYHLLKNIDAVLVEEDMAGSNTTLISPSMFKSFCYDAMKSRIDNIKKYKDKVVLHCCGNALAYMDMFISAGVDCYQSLQTGTEMELGYLKKTYGNNLAFWGGVPVENLIGGTPQDVRKDVRNSMNAAKDDGGFILGPSHSVAFGTKYDNFMAFLDEYDKLKSV